MGCFSWICKECKTPINSNSFEGEEVKLFLLRGGVILEMMEGEYNSYGTCFAPDSEDFSPSLRPSMEWSIPIHSKERDPWMALSDLVNSEKKYNGIAAIHTKCFKKKPRTRSERDPNQGWGKIRKKFRKKV